MLDDTADKMSRVMDEFHKIDKGMPIIRIRILMYIARQESMAGGGVMMADLVDYLGILQSSVWGHIAKLQHMDSVTKKAPGLLEQHPDPIEPRRHKIYLSAKGRELMNRLDRILNNEEYSP